MAPALTKILKNGHGVHLSSPPTSVRLDSNRSAMCSIELQPCTRLVEDGDLEMMWLNHSSFHSLDSDLASSLLDVSVNPSLTSCLQESANQCETESLPSPGSLFSLLSLNKGYKDSHPLSSVFPGVPGMFAISPPEHNSQESCVQHEQCSAFECGPDGGDVNHSSLASTSVCPPPYSDGDNNSQGCTTLFATCGDTLTQEKESGMGSSPSSQSYIGQSHFAPHASKAVLQDVVKERLYRQAGLQERAWRLQRRLQGLLGEQAVQHCTQQLEGLKRHSQHGKVFQDSLASTCPHVLPPQAGTVPHFCWQESSAGSCFFTEVRGFSHSSQLVLKGLQEALDSEATASSSSDEESEDRIHGNTSPISSEKQWLEERAELGSRWSWLQLRLAELEGRIQQLIEIHKRIRSTKGGVLLADSQPLIDQQIRQTLMKEISGLSCKASDADTEPCSPTRLLHNIERQSAQLNQIVNSLMPPLSFSPLSKQQQNSNCKRTFTSGQRGDALWPESSKRRRLTTRRLFKANVSFVCARTRPLVSYHKPKLFTFYSHSSSSHLDSETSSSTLSSCLTSSSCSCSSSFDPVVLCSNPDCSSCTALSSTSSRSTSHLGSSSSLDTCDRPQRVRGREEWYQRPLVISTKLFSPAKYKRHSSTPLRNSHSYKQHPRCHKNGFMGLSPIRMSGSHRSQQGTFRQKTRRRRRFNRVGEDEEAVPYHLCNLDENSDDVLEEMYSNASQKQASQGFVRKRQGESVYNINNVVMPPSMTKVEKLQYKDILTPRWRVVETWSLTEIEEAKEDSHEAEQVEDLTDEVFAQRHKALERREKSRWPCWGRRKCCRHPTRSGSVGGMYTSGGEESSVEWSSAQLEADEQPKSEEQLPQTPWEPRVFPLDEEEEELEEEEEEEAASLSNILLKVPSSGWTSVDSSTSKNSSFHVSPAQSPASTLPSGGHFRSRTPNGS